MNVKKASSLRRSQAARTAATRAALIGTARRLFAEHGFADVSTEMISSEAGVTRGALYHQFADKTELFAAVFEEVEIAVTGRIAVALEAATGDPLVGGVDAWLKASTEPEVLQIVLIDGPAVLGWERWREIGMRYGLGLVSAVLGHAMQEGLIARQPVAPLAHVLVGALDEAAQYVSRATNPSRARREVRAVLHRVIEAIAASG